MSVRTLVLLMVTGLLTFGVSGTASAATDTRPVGFDLEAARIPAVCGHPAARLHDGVKRFGTRPDGTSRGDASLVSGVHSSAVPIRKPIKGTQKGSSKRGSAVAAPVRCSAGGVDHPETVVLYSRSGTILGSSYLGSITHQEHASVTALSLRADHFRVHWEAYDGAGFNVHHIAATFTLRRGRLLESHVVHGR